MQIKTVLHVFVVSAAIGIAALSPKRSIAQPIVQAPNIYDACARVLTPQEIAFTDNKDIKYAIKSVVDRAKANNENFNASLAAIVYGVPVQGTIGQGQSSSQQDSSSYQSTLNYSEQIGLLASFVSPEQTTAWTQCINDLSRAQHLVLSVNDSDPSSTTFHIDFDPGSGVGGKFIATVRSNGYSSDTFTTDISLGGAEDFEVYRKNPGIPLKVIVQVLHNGMPYATQSMSIPPLFTVTQDTTGKVLQNKQGPQTAKCRGDNTFGRQGGLFGSIDADPAYALDVHSFRPNLTPNIDTNSNIYPSPASGWDDYDFTPQQMSAKLYCVATDGDANNSITGSFSATEYLKPVFKYPSDNGQQPPMQAILPHH